MLKRSIPLALALLAVASPAWAGLQKNGVEFGVYVPFNFPDNSITEEFFSESFPGTLSVGEGAGFGLLVGWNINQNFGIEVSWDRSQTKTDSKFFETSAFGRGDLGRVDGFLDAAFVSGLLSYPATEKISPYLILSAGVLRQEFKEAEFETLELAAVPIELDVLPRRHVSEFGWGAGVGSRFFMNDNVDLRVQVRSMFESGDYRNTQISLGLNIHWNRQ